MTGLIDARQPDLRGGGDGLVAAFGEAVLRGGEAKLARGKVADAVAVHGQLHRLGGGGHAPAFVLQRSQSGGVDHLELGHDDVGLVLLDRGAERLAVEHREDFAGVGELHRGRVGVAVAGDDPAAEALGGDGEFAAELARSEQHQGGEIHERAIAGRLRFVIPANAGAQ